MLRYLLIPLRWALFTLIGLLFAFVGSLTYLYYSADTGQPNVVVNLDSLSLHKIDSLSVCGNSTLRRNCLGIWELTTSGDALQRGSESGILMRDLLHYQEQTFVDQIRKIITSDFYLRFLRAFIRIFNSNMAAYISDEYRTEIYAISQSCSHEFDDFGSPYDRQLNYHAAHDIGHAMQEYMLVGCSSFAVSGAQSADGELLIGRNFDFWVGDDFARNKLITFSRPSRGYPFASVGWAGMIGVLSGMNNQGLTVTINAAKGSTPLRGATPISLLARTILQYASNISEAYAIADSCRTFVSESLLIASASDGRAAIIEKTPSQTALFDPSTDRVICTNHYQSTELSNSSHNLENIATSDSYYRFERLGELLDQRSGLTPSMAVEVLRDRYGDEGRDIGLLNEKSINQAIAHHAVVFQPTKRLMWVSTDPWQVGAMVCYDLNKIFAAETPLRLDSPEWTIPSDERFLREDLPRIEFYRQSVATLRKAIEQRSELDQAVIDAFCESNPKLYATWELLGDYYLSVGNSDLARMSWLHALSLELPRRANHYAIIQKIKNL